MKCLSLGLQYIYIYIYINCQQSILFEIVHASIAYWYDIHVLDQYIYMYNVIIKLLFSSFFHCVLFQILSLQQLLNFSFFAIFIFQSILNNQYMTFNKLSKLLQKFNLCKSAVCTYNNSKNQYELCSDRVRESGKGKEKPRGEREGKELQLWKGLKSLLYSKLKACTYIHK